LPHLDERNAKRRAIVKRYVASGASAIHAQFAESDQYVAHLAVCAVSDRNEFIAKLTAESISTGVYFPYLDTEFPTTKHLATSTLPVSETAKGKIVTLPCFPEMTQNEIDLVCRAIEKNNQFFEAP
jgi:dTDP-4-amino-4,6-dideoxygalactose transaminase